jgi:histidyl-tRNA synthetase
MLGKVYSFLDWDGWSGERVVLRPEGTIPAVRLYIENLKTDHPVKLFYIENAFSFEETGKEPRERWQCGAELVGGRNPEADVELIMLASQTLESLGIKGVELHLSHAGLIRALLQQLGLAPAQESQIFDRILDGETKVLEKVISNGSQLQHSLPLLFELKGRTSGFLKNLNASLGEVSPGLRPSLDDFTSITELLEATGCDFEIDLASGRGFEYYTGVMFQFYLGEQKLGGGGRYNDLIPLLGGEDIPAAGFALYIDRLMDLLAAGEQKEAISPEILVKCEINTTEGWKSAFEVACRLREVGYVAELDQGYIGGSEHGWVLRIRNGEKTSPFLLTNQITLRSVEATSIAEMLVILRQE